MSFSPLAVCQQQGSKPLAISGTFVYNVKVIGGWEKPKLPDSVYSCLIIMKSSRSKEEQFVVELSHAFAKYGVRYWFVHDKEASDLFLRLRMDEVIDKNWDEIVEMSNQLEHFYND